MKNILKFVFCALVITSAVNCSEQPQSLKGYSIENIINNSKPITMLDIGAELETIKLKTPKDIIIGNISGAVTTPSSIYIRTYSPAQVYRFDREGNYMNKISTKGRAKNEYNYVTSMFLNTDGNICIQDGSRVITYTPEGKFINPTSMEQADGAESASSLSSHTEYGNKYMDKQGNIFESFMVILGNEQNNLIVTAPNNDTIFVKKNKIKYDFPEYLYVSIDSRTVYYVGDEIAYHQQYSDTVHTYDQNTSSLKPRFYFTDHAKMENEDYQNVNESMKDDVYVTDVTEDKSYIYANISNKNYNQLYLIDKKSGEFFEADFLLNHPEDDELSFYPKWESNDEFIFFYDVTQNPEPTILLMKKL